ncbi:MAG TPA: fumarylacetoacetate hydrolase family protein [Burkholderiaceae bacterium]
MTPARRPRAELAGTYAQAVLAAWDAAAPIDRATAPRAPADLAAAEAVQREVVAARRARGETPVGLKIGFTNRTIWPIYGVHHPIWGPVYDSTLTLLEGTRATVSTGRFHLPRLEPEIVFGLGATPGSAEPAAMLAAIAWVAHGFEIVQSPFAAWKFTAPEAIAAQALHGALIVGPRVDAAGTLSEQALASLELELWRDDNCVAVGQGGVVLDSPLHALCHLARELQARGERLAAGAIVTTGTLTDAQPLAPGQRWHTRLRGIGLPGLELVATA